jgi:hypothetical protein
MYHYHDLLRIVNLHGEPVLMEIERNGQVIWQVAQEKTEDATETNRR